MFFASDAFLYTHVVLSLIGIAVGYVVVAGLLLNQRLDTWTVLFLATTVLTSVTGFLFPFKGPTPAHALGALSLVTLGVALYARYAKKLAGKWRRWYVVTAVVSLYFNVFVLFVQAFQKVGFLHALAPTQQEPPFFAAQLVNLIAFIAAGWYAVKRFRDKSDMNG